MRESETTQSTIDNMQRIMDSAETQKKWQKTQEFMRTNRIEYLATTWPYPENQPISDDPNTNPTRPCHLLRCQQPEVTLYRLNSHPTVTIRRLPDDTNIHTHYCAAEFIIAPLVEQTATEYMVTVHRQSVLPKLKGKVKYIDGKQHVLTEDRCRFTLNPENVNIHFK